MLVCWGAAHPAHEFVEACKKFLLADHTVAVGVVLGDLPYLVVLFMTLLVFFAIIGHLLFGHTLTEWSQLADALHTSWDTMMGEYVYMNLVPAWDEGDSFYEYLALVYYYFYVILMTFIVRTIQPRCSRDIAETIA